MKSRLILALAFIALFVTESIAQPPSLPGNDGGGNVTDSPIHFLIPLAMAIGAFIGIKKLKT
jgi:hypothetical protein